MIYTFTLNTAVDRIIYFEEELERKKNNKSSHYLYDVGGKATHVSIILSQLNLINFSIESGLLVLLSAESRDFRWSVNGLSSESSLAWSFSSEEFCAKEFALSSNTAMIVIMCFMLFIFCCEVMKII